MKVSMGVKKYYFAILSLVFLIDTPIFAGGLDLTLLYGSRYVGLGGQQIAVVDDAYSSFYNPAGLMGVKNFDLAIDSSTLFTQNGAPIGGANQQKTGELNLGPLFFLGSAYRLTDRVVIGLGVYPTALQGGKFSNVTYSDDITNKEWSNKLVRIEIAPSVALKLYGPLSIGMSYRLGYTRLENQSGIFSVANIDSTMSAWDGKGFKIGTSLKDLDGFSAALTWRFRQTMNLKGSTTQTVDLDALSLGTGAASSVIPTSMRVNIPAQLQFGLAYQWIPNKFLTAFAYEYTANQVIKSMQLVDRTGVNSFQDVPLKYRDGHTFHLGAEYVFDMASDRKLRTDVGFAVDRAVTKSEYPNPILPPDADYYGYALAARYEMERNQFGLAFNYGQYSSKSSTINSSVPAGTVFPGEYSLLSFMIVADYQYHF